MFNCGWCGAEVPPGFEYCPNCGQLYTATRTCSKCGAQVPINIRLCSQCGTFLEGAAVEATAAGIIPPATQLPQQAVQTTPAGYYTQPPLPRRAPARKKKSG